MPSVLDLFSLAGRTALITGATRGIGKSLALALAEAGADVVLIQRDTSNTSTRDEIRALGRKATIVAADLAEREQLRGLVKKIITDGHDISILVNCGGIQRRHLAHEFPDEDWDEVCRHHQQLKGDGESNHANHFGVGPTSQPQRRLYTLSRCRRIHADTPADGYSAASRFHHQCCFACLVSRRVECAGICECKGRRGSTYEEFVKSVGCTGDQCQCGECLKKSR